VDNQARWGGRSQRVKENPVAVQMSERMLGHGLLDYPYDSMRINLEFDSNVMNESDSQFEKHFEQRIPTLFGIMIG
jgi:hypothetical protein